MSERLETTESEGTGETAETESWATGDHYSYMKVDAGTMGDSFYYSLPAFTILVKTQEELEAINAEFSALFSKYTEGIIVGTSHEASLILSVNQASDVMALQHDVIETLRARIFELTGSHDAAGDWKGES